MSPGFRNIDDRSRFAPYWVSCIAVVCTSIILTGCSRSSFLGRQIDDWTARFNTHYNANRTFNEAERKLLREDEPVDMDRYLLVFQVPSLTGRSAEFEQVIAKSADLLRKHPHSKWVDDALMLIGKSYFYQSNYVGAEQKFNEVIALESSLHDEAVFWLARTLVASQSGQDAEDLIRTALSSENLHDKWRPRLHLLLGDLRTDVGDWEGAIQALEVGLDDVDDGDLAARAEFLLGQLYETVEDYPASIEAYKRAREKGPLYELSFASMYSRYRVEGLYGDAETALAGLQKMARDNKHYQYLDRIQYLRARVYAATGDPIAARRILLSVLYPKPGQPTTSIRGEIHYRLAEIDRDLTGDFYRAAAHFDTAASALRTTSVQNEIFTPDAIVNARTTAEVFSSYREVAAKISEMDSLLYLGTLDDEAFDEAVRKVREQLAIQAAKAVEEIERRQAQSSFRRVSNEANVANRNTQPTGGGQAGRYGFLNHKDIRLVQEAFLSFRQIWGDRPLIPGWRREEVVLSTRSEQRDQSNDVEGVAEQRSLGSGAVLNFLPPVDISRVPRDSVSRAAMKDERSSDRYKLANILFLSMGLPDSAAHWYRLVIDESEDESVALRAQYAMAEVHQALDDYESADRLMAQIIQEHPESVFADRARVTLGIEIDAERSDTLEVALNQYSEAYKYWNEGQLQQALNSMIRTAADYPRTEVAAKAMLAGAAIFSDMARLDSLDLFGLIPLGDSVFTVDEIERARAALAVDSVSVDSMSSDSTFAASGRQDTTAMAGGEAPAGPSGREDEPEPFAPAKPVAKGVEKPIAEDVDEVVEEGAAKSIVESVDEAVEEGAEKPLTEGPDKEILDDRSGERARNEEGDLLQPTKPQPDVGDEDRLLRRRDPTRNTEDDVPVDDVPRVAADDDTTAGATVNQVAAADSIPEIPADEAILSDQTQTDADTIGQAQDLPSLAPPEPPEPPKWIDAEYYINDIIPQPLTLHSLFAAVEDHFADSEFGTRASELKRGLVAYRDETFARPDTTSPRVEPAPVGTSETIGVSDSSLVSIDN